MAAETADPQGAGRERFPAPRSITEAAAAMQSGALTAVALVERCLERIAALDPSINAFITVNAEQARADAQEADRELSAGSRRGSLHGIPVSVKDLVDVRGLPTTAASRVRDDRPATADAPVIARLRDAGAIILGKTNLHEFAFGTTNEDSAFGPVHHPLDGTRSPGGSSGGSAASVLAGMALASVGTDTGGSVRIPAAACGLVGLKPERGDVPSDGVVPLSRTLDHVGPICRTVDDAETLYAAMRGLRTPQEIAGVDIRSLRLGVLGGYFTALLDPFVADAFGDACERLRRAGATLEPVEIEHAGDIAPVYLHLVLAEAAAYHAATLESRPQDYTPNVRIRLEMGRYMLAEDYVRAREGRDWLTREVDAAVTGRSALLLPSLPMIAPRLGASTVTLGSVRGGATTSTVEEPVRNAMLRLTQLFNVTGHPAITLPCVAHPQPMPVGLQLAGARHKTLELLGVARTIERYV